LVYLISMKLFVAAKAVVVRPDGKILLLRESGSYDEGSKEGSWDVPGGRINPGEVVTDALIREVQEECGLSISSSQIIEVFDHFAKIHDEDCHIVGIYFLARVLNDIVTLSSDHDAFEWVDPTNFDGKMLVSNIGIVIDKSRELI